MHRLPQVLALAAVVAGTALPPLGFERKLEIEALARRQESSQSCYSGEAPSIGAPKTNV
jgi:hypothetical protein